MIDDDLGYLCGAYLHQDFDIFADDPIDVVDVFVAADPQRTAGVVRDIERLLASSSSDMEVEHSLADLGCDVYCRPDDGGYRGFLEAVRQRILDLTGL